MKSTYSGARWNGPRSVRSQSSGTWLEEEDSTVETCCSCGGATAVVTLQHTRVRTKTDDTHGTIRQSPLNWAPRCHLMLLLLSWLLHSLTTPCSVLLQDFLHWKGTKRGKFSMLPGQAVKLLFCTSKRSGFWAACLSRGRRCKSLPSPSHLTQVRW